MADKFLNGVAVHCTTVKPERVARVTLGTELTAALKIYFLAGTLQMAVKDAILPVVLLMMYTELKSLADCRLDLHLEAEKRLLIELSNLQQSCKLQELSKAVQTIARQVLRTK